MELSEPVKLLVSFAIGAVIGLERQINENRGGNKKYPVSLLGLRTFALVSTLGTIAGFFLELKWLPALQLLPKRRFGTATCKGRCYIC